MSKFKVIALAIILIVLGILTQGDDGWRARAENAVGPSNLILCNKIATQAVGVSASTKMITGVTGQTILICGWDVSNTGATGTFAFTSGTGSNCGTSSVTVIPALNITNTAPAVDRQQYATIQIGTTAVPLDFCITPSVNTIAAVVWFAQF
jgi:hypothetical protein